MQQKHEKDQASLDKRNDHDNSAGQTSIVAPSYSAAQAAMQTINSERTFAGSGIRLLRRATTKVAPGTYDNDDNTDEYAEPKRKSKNCLDPKANDMTSDPKTSNTNSVAFPDARGSIDFFASQQRQANEEKTTDDKKLPPIFKGNNGRA